MSARHKLNRAHLMGALILAALACGLTGSWAVFLIVAGCLIVLAVHAGDIRLDGPRRRR
jgi:hypothetical protein